MKRLIFGLIVFWVPSAMAEGIDEAQVLFLGEVHDNPAHHARQAEIVAEVQPRAVVWEMLDAAEAARVTPELIEDETALGAALGWDDSGWPDFSMYYPIFAAAPRARHFGAELPRDRAREVMREGRQSVDLNNPSLQRLLAAELEPEIQAERESLQMAAHCDALPEEMLPMMVDAQRVRDSMLAAVAVQAFEETGGPVVVITGNGHADRDRGAARLFGAVAPDVRLFALGQTEDGHAAPDGAFDRVESAPPVEREDPCAVFRKQ